MKRHDIHILKIHSSCELLILTVLNDNSFEMTCYECLTVA